jgi:predicted TIM-barrel fold metal-dependent hydrolase
VTERYECGIDFDAVTAIDVHTHVEVDCHGHNAYDDELVDATRAYFRMGDAAVATVDDLAAHYRQRRAAAVVFTIDAETATGHPPNSVADLVAGAARHNDVLIPFGTVDPLKGARALTLVAEQVALGVRGFKFHPSMQGFAPNDRVYYPIYEAIAAAGVPALFHTGQTGLGSGLPGGHGIKMRYSDPMLLDDVAADFPGLTIVMAHPAVPWIDAQMAIVAHKANVYLDLSGYAPKYFPPALVTALGRQLRTKALFGTDYPYVQIDRWTTEFAALNLGAETEALILKGNARKVLGVSPK